MSVFLGFTGYEYRMGVRRWGVWLACALGGIVILSNFDPGSGRFAVDQTGWQTAGDLAYVFNLLLPVVGGIAMADRLPRDWQYTMRELQRSTPLSRPAYVVGKYVGALLSVLTPVLAVWLAWVAVFVAAGADVGFVGQAMVAFLAVVMPAYIFVGAFSIACPAVLPVRVYQVLFTGYWYWGNFFNPDFMPTLNGTYLTPSGAFAASGFFGSAVRGGELTTSAADAVLNLVVLAVCAAGALLALERYLAWREVSV